MALSNQPAGLPTKMGQVKLGQNGRILQWGTFAFSTTDPTGLLPVKMHNIEAILISPSTGVATDETVTGPTIGSGAALAVDNTGTITITRTGAAKTSALVCHYLIIGY